MKSYGRSFYGHRMAGCLFEYEVGTTELVVYRGKGPRVKIDVILFDVDSSTSDPRPDIRRAATEWLRERQVQRAG